jgi:putative CocE/NonD family hydrolase
MRILPYLVLLFLAPNILGQGNSLDSSWVLDNYTKMEKMIPMRDGVKLFTSIYIPKDASEKHPILIKRTPYSAKPYGAAYFDFWSNYLRNYLRDGYIMVIQDVRGKFMSEGQFKDVRPFNPDKKGTETDEASDSYDTIDWLIKNIPGNNGNAGVFGVSYPGFYSTMAALSGHPALKAVSPQAPVTDWFIGDDFHHNGAFFFMDGWSFYSGSFGQRRPKPSAEETTGFDAHSNDNYDFYLKTGALKNFLKLAGDSIAFWKELYDHPNYDDWWKARNPRNFVTDVKPAILVVGGLYDAEDLFGAWNLYKAIESKSKNTSNRIVMGPWSHEYWATSDWTKRADGSRLGHISFSSKTSEWYQNNIEVPFFNYYLKGKGDLKDFAEATIFFSGENQWRKFDRWPPAEKTDKPIFLHSNGTLSWNAPQDKNSFSAYTSDPASPVPYAENVHWERTREYMLDDQRFASRRPDVLVFETGPLDADLRLAGTVTAKLNAAISTTDADFVVKLIDVFPNDYPLKSAADTNYPMGGYQMLVRGEIMRGRYRNSYEKPQAFMPGKIEVVQYDLPDVAHVFQKGHRIMIQIQSSWFPLADRNPQQFIDIYHCDDKDFIRSDIRIYHDAAHPSQIILPVAK